MVEETSKAKLEDVEKILRTSEIVKNRLGIHRRVLGIIHSKKGFDLMIYRRMIKERIAGANCDDDLSRKIRSFQ